MKRRGKAPSKAAMCRRRARLVRQILQEYVRGLRYGLDFGSASRFRRWAREHYGMIL